ncbi:DNA topoisomerase 3-alpha [Asimina triloba]
MDHFRVWYTLVLSALYFIKIFNFLGLFCQAIVREQQGHPSWGSYAQRLLDPDSGLWRNPGNGGHDDKAHPPIHPTKFSAGESGWSPDHSRLYELVVRHFLACVSQPAVGAETTVEIDIAGEQFSASGRLIVASRIFVLSAPLEMEHAISRELDSLPFHSVGYVRLSIEVQFIPTALTLDSGVTRPPPLLSESDLLGCMDKGEALVMGYDDMGYELWKPYLRAMMECDMKAVSLGQKRKSEVLETCLQQMKACFLDARLKKVKLLEAMEIFFERSHRPGGDEQHTVGAIVRSCNLCHESDMVLRQRPEGNFMVGCLRFPQELYQRHLSLTKSAPLALQIVVASGDPNLDDHGRSHKCPPVLDFLCDWPG